MWQPDTPTEFSGRNIQRKFRETTTRGAIYSVVIEIDKEWWEALEDVPVGSLIGGWLYYTSGDNPPPPQPELPHPNAPFWQGLCKNGLLNSLDLRQVLNCDAANASETKEALYKAFRVKSLNEIDPHRFCQWAQTMHLNNLVMMAEQVEQRLSNG